MTATATGLLNVARSQIGYREGPDNDNKYGQWYGMNHAPYCAIGLTWCGAAAGATEIFHGRYAYCPSWVNAFHDAGGWLNWRTAAWPGDIVFFDWSGEHGTAGHVGVIERVEASTLVTIEFNTTSGLAGSQSDGGGVYRRRRSAQFVVGYGRPLYARQTSPSPAPVIHTGNRIPIPLMIDGVWGPATTARLQHWLTLTPTGVINPATRTALQHRLRVPADGIWGPVTRRAMQSALHVYQDGIWGPETVRALQRYLNRAVA